MKNINKVKQELAEKNPGLLKKLDLAIDSSKGYTHKEGLPFLLAIMQSDSIAPEELDIIYKSCCKFCGKPLKFKRLLLMDCFVKSFESLYPNIVEPDKLRKIRHIIDCFYEYKTGASWTFDKWIKDQEESFSNTSLKKEVVEPLQQRLKNCKELLKSNNQYLLLEEVFSMGYSLALDDLFTCDYEVNRRAINSLKKGGTTTNTNKARTKISIEDTKAYLTDYFTERLNFSSDTKFYNSLADNSVSPGAIKKAIQRLLKSDMALNNKFKNFKKKHNLR